MVETNPAASIFQDARVLYADALDELERGNLRNSAEKAWGAAKRATDALILARTGELPPTSSQTTRQLRRLRRQYDGFDALASGYFDRITSLHGECFYNGMCEPVEDTEFLIRETINYIRDAEELAALPL